MKLTARAKPRGSRTELLSLAAGQETEVQDDIDAENQDPSGQIPQNGFDRIARRVERLCGKIRAEQAGDPLIGRQAKRGTLVLNLPRQGGLS